MANQQDVPLRTVIVGASYGVWMAFLVGVAVMLVGLIARETMMRFCPECLVMTWGIPLHEVPGQCAQVFSHFKVVLGFFFLLAVALSCWWRALPAPKPPQ